MQEYQQRTTLQLRGQRHAFKQLPQVETSQRQYEHMQQNEGGPVHFFRMMKQVALFGYFTSEVGATQAMRYVETPGRYDPCAPYKPGDKAWARHV